jgi:hypothetical protein
MVQSDEWNGWDNWWYVELTGGKRYVYYYFWRTRGGGDRYFVRRAFEKPTHAAEVVQRLRGLSPTDLVHEVQARSASKA